MATDYTLQIQAIQDAAAQVESLTSACFATDAANVAMNSALREARKQLDAAQAALITPIPAPVTAPAVTATT